MNQKSVAIVIAALLLVGAFVFLSMPADCAAPPDFQPVVDERSSTGVVEAVAAGDTRTGTPTDAVATTTATAERAAVEASASRRPLPEDAKWVKVTVVDGDGGKPVPGAEVFWHDETVYTFLNDDKDEWSVELQAAARDPVQLAMRGGWSTLADDKGVARVTLREQTTVAARHESRFGVLHLRKNTVTPPGGHQVVLQPDRTLLVRVVDHANQPVARVPVSIGTVNAEGHNVGYLAWNVHARTDAEGMAQVTHLQTLQEDVKNDNDLQQVKVSYVVRLALPGFAQKGTPFDIDNPPLEPVVLRVPACGSVRVSAEIAGQPMRAFGHAGLSESSDEPVEPNYHQWLPTGDDGTVLFEHVVLNRRYQVGAWEVGLHEEITGPTAPGQCVEVTLRPDPNALLLRGRLVLEDGSPVASQAVMLITRGPELGEHKRLRTDASGMFMTSLGPSRDDNKVESMSFQLHRKDQLPLRVDVPPRTLRAGIEELGDLRLSTGPLVVSGRFLIGEAPFKGQINLHVQRELPPDGKRPARWTGAGDLLVHKDENGVFSVHGTTTPGRYRLSFNASESLPIQPIEFVPGTKDLVVQVDVGSPLAASVLLPASCDGEQIQAVLVPPASQPAPQVEPNKPGRKQPNLTATLQKQQQGGERHDLQWMAVPTGTFTLELRLASQLQPLLTIPDVVLPPPEGGDPRLVDIDLRDALRSVTLTLFDHEGKRLEEAYGIAFPFGQSEDSEWKGQMFHQNPSTLLLGKEPVDLLVAMRGYRPVRLHCSGATAEVRFEPWPTVEVVVADIPSTLENAYVSLRLVPQQAAPNGANQRYRAQWNSGSRADWMMPEQDWIQLENGIAKCPVADGAYTVELQLTHVHRSANDNSEHRSTKLNAAAPVTVFSSTPRTMVHVEAAEWQRAIEQAKQPRRARKG